MMPLVLSSLLLLSAVPTVSPDPKSLEIPTEKLARAQQLVHELASDLYRERDRATRELERMGRLALPALAVARSDDDPEVRLRTKLLLPRAEADDLRARVDTFLADTDAKYDHDLPGWQRFRVIAGDTKATRDLFVQILKNPLNFEMLIALKGVPGEAIHGLAATVGSIGAASMDMPSAADLGKAVVNRRQKLVQNLMVPQPFNGGVYRAPATPELSDVAILLLAESYVSERIAPFGNNQYHIQNFFYSPAGRDAMTGAGPHGPAFRALTIHWMDTRDGVMGIQNAMNLAQMQNLGPQKIAHYAARLLRLPGGPAYARASAATMIARHGGKEYLFDLIAQFSDSSILVRGAVNANQNEILMKDVALAMVLILTGQDPKEYGFDAVNTAPGTQYNYTNFRFRGDEKITGEHLRATAFKKWQDFEISLHASVAGPAGVALTVKKSAENTDDEIVKKAPK